MKFYDENIVNEVRKRRRNEGLSIKKLEKIFGISNTTISRWIRDIANSNQSFQRARKKEKESKDIYQNDIKKIKIDKKTAMIFCSLLYWCEGSKYPSSNFLAFTNSDEKLILVFLSLLRRGFEIDEKKLRVQLQIHTTHNPNKILSYWSKLLSIPKNQFHKSTITKPTKNMKRQNYLGTCAIKYFDVKLLLGITGLYESFSDKILKN